MDFKFEVCSNGVESSLAAQRGGADRVELCAGIPDGGTTPSYGEIKQARSVLTTTRLHVIIRPRGGDFLYSRLETERMIEDIELCKKLGVDGVVFGCLDKQGNVDVDLCRELMAHCGGMSVTFHRAFDRCAHPQEALEQIVDLGFNRILTSGLQPKAIDGAPMLKELHRQAAGRIIILAGSGVNEENIRSLYQQTGISEFHFSAREPVPTAMRYLNPAFATEDAPHALNYTSERRVRQTIAQLRS